MNKIILFVFILSGVRCQCEEDQENIIKIIQPSRLNIQVILDVGPIIKISTTVPIFLNTNNNK